MNMPSNLQILWPLVWVIALIWSTNGAPVASSDNMLLQFLKSLNHGNCSLRKNIAVPLFGKPKNSELLPKTFNLSIPLEACQVSNENAVAPICNEVFDSIYNISTCFPEKVPKNNVKIQPISIEPLASSEVCSGFAVNEKMFIVKEEYIAHKLADQTVCSIVCRDEVMKVCSFLLWSYQVQAAIDDSLNKSPKAVGAPVDNSDLTAVESKKPSDEEPPKNSDRNAEKSGAKVSLFEDGSHGKQGKFSDSALDPKKKPVGDIPKDEVKLNDSKPSHAVDKTLLNNLKNPKGKQTAEDGNDNDESHGEAAKDQKMQDPKDHKVTSTVLSDQTGLGQNFYTLSTSENQASDNVEGTSKNRTHTLPNETKESGDPQDMPTNKKKQLPLEISVKDSAAGNNLDEADKANDSAKNSGLSAPIDVQGKDVVGSELFNVKDIDGTANDEETPKASSAYSTDGQEVKETPGKADVLDDENQNIKNDHYMQNTAASPSEFAKEESSDMADSAVDVPLLNVDDQDNNKQPPSDDESYGDDAYGDNGESSITYDGKIARVMTESGQLNNNLDSANPNAAGNLGSAVDAKDTKKSSSVSSDGSVEEKQVISGVQATFPEQEDAHFFFYFITIVIFAMGGYVLFHNKQKIFALIIEGRHERRRRSGAAYRKLDTK